MKWSPEILGAITAGGTAAAVFVRKMGWLELPLRRNGHAVRPECNELHNGFKASIGLLENDRTENKTMISQHEKRIDKQDLKFDKIMDGLSELKSTVVALTVEVKRVNGKGP